jgi:putative peptide zinc metalloprotease protein
MTAPLLSSLWYRVSSLKPQLRSQARLHRHRYRGEVWYILQDPASTRIHRFTPAARLVIAAMDGKRSVQKLWELANWHLGEDAPTQDEIIHLLGQLHTADLLQSDVTPDVAELFERGERDAKARRRRSYTNPMAVRIPLWDPNAFLDRVAGFNRLLWSRWGALLWSAVVLPVLVLVPSHWPELTNNLSDRVLEIDNLLLLGLVFAITKALHELGHATAVKAGGGEVHDMGIMLLVLMPVPYVEASASSVFKSKYRRALVGGAGMLVELFLAAIAFYLWLLLEPGVVRATMFNVMVVAGVSTLVFNGNPLLRYDAYYILSDLIEIPNLANRSLRYWGYLLERYLLGMRDAEPPQASPSETAWLGFYGIASSICRVLVTITIALLISGRFFIIGVLLAAWALVAMAVVPLYKGIKHLASSPRLHKNRRHALVVTASVAGALALLVFVVPLPFRSQAEGFIWLPEQAVVRAGTNGFLRRYLITSGTRVEKGMALAESEDPALAARVHVSEARVAELEASYAAAFVDDRAQLGIVREQLASVRAQLERDRERDAHLVAYAGTDGIFMAPQAVDMPGRYFRQGGLLGYVIGNTRPVARIVVPQGEIDMVRGSISTNEIEVRMSQRPDLALIGKIIRQVPAGDDHLPSRALAIEGGGRISVDPRDAKGTKSMARMFQFDIELPKEVDVALYGERVYVRFDHQKEPLATQWYRGIWQLFLTHFNV